MDASGPVFLSQMEKRLILMSQSMMNKDYSDEELLRKVQLVELETLKLIDDFCAHQGIRYCLEGGTLLGAIRHEGFIPWDDDLDISMTVDDYERFLDCWNSNPPEGYFLQTKDSEPAYTRGFAKVRKENTTFLQSGEQGLPIHTGFFVDIFPYFRMPTGRFSQKIFKLNALIYALLCREYVPSRSSIVVKAASHLILCLVRGNNRARLRKRLWQRLSSYNANTNLPYVCIENTECLSHQLPSDYFRDSSRMRFEDGFFPCPVQFNAYLHGWYGNYLEFPPLEERTWTHHPVLIDFDRSNIDK